MRGWLPCLKRWPLDGCVFVLAITLYWLVRWCLSLTRLNDWLIKTVCSVVSIIFVMKYDAHFLRRVLWLAYQNGTLFSCLNYICNEERRPLPMASVTIGLFWGVEKGLGSYITPVLVVSCIYPTPLMFSLVVPTSHPACISQSQSAIPLCTSLNPAPVFRVRSRSEENGLVVLFLTNLYLTCVLGRCIYLYVVSDKSLL